MHPVLSPLTVGTTDGKAEVSFPLPAETPLLLVLHTLKTGRRMFLALPEADVQACREVALSVPDRVERGDAGVASLEAAVDDGGIRRGWRPRMRLWRRALLFLRLSRLNGALKLQGGRREQVADPFWQGLNDLVAEMPEGRFYSTAATRTYIEILMDMRQNWNPTAIRFLDTGEAVRVTDIMYNEGRPFGVVSDRAILIQRSRSLPEVGGDGPLQVVAQAPGHGVHVGDCFDVRVQFDPGKASVTTPVLDLRIPAHLHLVGADGSENGESLRREIPLQDKRSRQLHFCAVRRGRGTLTCRVFGHV